MRKTKNAFAWPSLALFSTIAGAQSGDEAAQIKDVEEVIVTAQKRTERIQDVPISIEVVGGGALEEPSVKSVTEALARVPGIVAAISDRAGGNTSQITMRGVSPAPSLSSTVGYYLDSIPFGFVRRSTAPDANPYDLDRIEALRGPQGTLYGSSALNGVVRVLTKDANLDVFEMKARASSSSTEAGGSSYRGDMALNVPIVEGKLAARAVLGYEDQAGWIDKPIQNDANDAELRNLRLKVNAAPTDQLSVGLLAWFSRSDFGAPPNSPDGRTTTSALPEPSSVDYDAFSARLGYEFAGFTLTSATSYIDFKEALIFDYSPFVPDTFTDSRKNSEVLAQEVTLNSNQEGPWVWSIGGIYRDAEESFFQGLLPILPRLADEQTTSESFAIFGEVGRKFADGKFEITAGLRYFEDEVEDTNLIDGMRVAAKFDATTPRVVFTWYTSEQMTLYASYGEGFRSGMNQNFIVTNAAPNFPAVDPDTLINYEVGAKGGFWSGRGTFETAAYFIDWKDVQQQVGMQVSPSVLTVALINGDSASGAGFDAAVTVEPLDGLILRGSISWNNLTFDSDVVSLAGSASSPVTLVPFEKGDRPSFSPETTASLGADYNFAFGSKGYSGRFMVSANYISELANPTVAGTSVLIEDGDTVLIGRASFQIDAPKKWSATLFIDNFGNENGVSAGDPYLDAWYSRLRPRTVGLQLDYRLN